MQTFVTGSFHNAIPQSHAERLLHPFPHPIACLLKEIPLQGNSDATHICHLECQMSQSQHSQQFLSQSQHSQQISEDSRHDVELSHGVEDTMALATGLQKKVDDYIHNKWRKKPLLFEQLYFLNGKRIIRVPEGPKFVSFNCAICVKDLKINNRVQCQAVLDHIISWAHVKRTLLAGGLSDEDRGHESWFENNVNTDVRASRYAKKSGERKVTSKRKRQDTDQRHSKKPTQNPEELRNFLLSICGEGTVAGEHLNGHSASGKRSIPLTSVADWMSRMPRVTLGQKPTTH